MGGIWSIYGMLHWFKEEHNVNLAKANITLKRHSF
ncbi:hypothetical protein SNOG_06025 [Parastagonospora nodorum SN15]|uniref:Uncharacterized protein n=1 Tax=Phaeosphaeria nodorum (strain SN15 / ATCC MYA-4574 / FGSC 10173) TaxID=321614 RepID=Q0UQD9_PHANO|nr:hypothetical protein SNOG_06025 [Parastagonospora nodorum SN15]EAT87089.1 hypothetical protein SNOG_06025 [Parastagonospora nodorum SN15]